MFVLLRYVRMCFYDKMLRELCTKSCEFRSNELRGLTQEICSERVRAETRVHARHACRAAAPSRRVHCWQFVR